MVPLTTRQGLSGDALKAVINNRDVYIWGSGPTGRGVLVSLHKQGITPAGFIDGRASESGKKVRSFPIFDAESILNNANAFVIIANVSARKAAEEMCERYGRKKSTSYLTHYQIARPEAAIDVAGMCNVTCPHCPRGNMDGLLPEGCMSFDTYAKILNKLVSDVPNLINVELHTWGEPLLNPEIGPIIEFTESKVPCTVTTNLLLTDMIEPVLKANPSRLNIAVYGHKEWYEARMKKASWERLTNNLQLLKECRDRFQSTTTITIAAYSSGRNSDTAEHLIGLAGRLDFALCFGIRYLNPYEHYAAYCAKSEIPAIAHAEIENSSWSVDAMLRLAKRDRDNPCLPQRIFPIINWDTSVALCHTYYGPVIAKRYLDISWKELLKLRHGAKQCHPCQENGLHRLDIDVLRRKYGLRNEENT